MPATQGFAWTVKTATRHHVLCTTPPLVPTAPLPLPHPGARLKLFLPPKFSIPNRGPYFSDFQWVTLEILIYIVMCATSLLYADRLIVRKSERAFECETAFAQKPAANRGAASLCLAGLLAQTVEAEKRMNPNQRESSYQHEMPYI